MRFVSVFPCVQVYMQDRRRLSPLQRSSVNMWRQRMRQRKSHVRLEHKDAPLAKETHFTLIHIQHIPWMIPFRLENGRGKQIDWKQHSLLSGQLLNSEDTFLANGQYLSMRI